MGNLFDAVIGFDTSGVEKGLDVLTETFDTAEELNATHENINKSLMEQADLEKDVSKEIARQQKELQKQQKELSKIEKDKDKAFGKLTKGTFLEDSVGKIDLLSSKVESLEGLFTGMKTTGVASFQVLTQLASRFLLPLAAIAAAIFVLQQAWQINLGGIQSQSFKVFGKLQDTVGKFILTFQKGLKKLDPLIRPLITSIGNKLVAAIEIVTQIFGVLFTLIEPILDLLGELGALFSDIFPQDEGEGMVDIIKLLGTAFKIFAKVITTPLRLMVGLIRIFRQLLPIAQIVGLIGTAFDLAGKAIIGFFKPVLDFIQPIIEGLTMILELLGVLDNEQTGRGFASGDFGPARFATQQAQAVSQTSTSTTNAPNITIQTTGPIDDRSAPRLGEMISQNIKFDRKVL